MEASLWLGYHVLSNICINLIGMRTSRGNEDCALITLPSTVQWFLWKEEWNCEKNHNRIDTSWSIHWIFLFWSFWIKWIYFNVFMRLSILEMSDLLLLYLLSIFNHLILSTYESINEFGVIKNVIGNNRFWI